MVQEETQQEDENVKAEYSQKSDFSKAKVVSEAINRCVEARSKEMKQGFFNTVIKDGMPIRTWVPDTRKTYISSVESLRILLHPEIRRSKNSTNIKGKKQSIFNEHCYQEPKVIIKGSKYKWGVAGKKYIPEKDETILLKVRNQYTTTKIRGGWNSQVDSYWDAMLEVYDTLFEFLSDLIDELNYFKQSLGF